MFNFFKKVQKTETRKLTVEELDGFLDKIRQEREQEILDSHRQFLLALKSQFSNLGALFRQLRDAEIPEPRASASKAVKDKFARHAITVIDAIQWPQATNLEDIERTIGIANSKLAEIRISPKELAHVKFFFDEHIKQIAQQINGIEQTIVQLRNVLGSPKMVEIKKLTQQLDELKKLKEKLVEAEIRAERLLGEAQEFINQAERITLHDLTELNNYRNKKEELEKQEKELNQIFVEAFSPIRRLLKRAGHDLLRDKELIKLAESYANDPKTAFETDQKNRIGEILVKIILEFKERRFKAEQKEIAKAEMLLGKLKDLEYARADMKEVREELKVIEERIAQLMPLEEDNVRAKDRKSELEKNAKARLMAAEGLHAEIEQLRQRISAQKADLEAELGRVSNQRIEIAE
jgi:hypothetical protein